jgi:5'-AMP-activated protein kinase catalytic alpha subunit
MWAAGVILYAALCGELPFDHRDQKSSFKLIVAGKYHAPNVRLSAECADLLNRLLCVNKVKRLTASEALQHPFLGSLRERNRRRSDDEDLRDVAESPWTNDAKFAATENESVSLTACRVAAATRRTKIPSATRRRCARSTRC